MQSLWTDLDHYFEAMLRPGDSALAAALADNAAQGLPAIDVSPLQGRFLEMLVRMSGAKRILEIGTLGGYSSICLARGAGPDGKVVTLELDPRHAAVARTNIDRAGVGARVEIVVGAALDSLERLSNAALPAFDMVFVDADKDNNPAYLEAALDLSRPGTVIIFDNVVRDGKVLDPHHQNPSVQGVRKLMDAIAGNPRLMATALQTTGVKGHDGFAMVIVGD